MLPAESNTVGYTAWLRCYRRACHIPLGSLSSSRIDRERKTTGILAGRQPVGLTGRGLMSDTRLPLESSGQRRALGFAN